MVNIYFKMYKGVEIEKCLHNGYYIAFMYGIGYLKADTLRGIKSLINENIKYNWSVIKWRL